jgi:hypothetical protein
VRKSLISDRLRARFLPKCQGSVEKDLCDEGMGGVFQQTPRDCMIEIQEVNEIFEKITETYEEPVPIGGRCESNVFYRVGDLSEDDLDLCAEYVAQRIINVVSPSTPQLLLKLPGGYTFFAERLSAILSEMIPGGKEIPLEQYIEKKIANGHGEKYRGHSAILITDVITTARSSLEAHTKATIRGIPVLAWACLIDRTFGPGPVPVVSALTGAPVRVLTQMG